MTKYFCWGRYATTRTVEASSLPQAEAAYRQAEKPEHGMIQCREVLPHELAVPECCKTEITGDGQTTEDYWRPNFPGVSHLGY